jgi:hypothetical protein
MFKKLGSLIKAVDGRTFENDPHDAIIDAAIRTLSSPRVPVIDGLDEALKKFSFDMPDISDYQTAGEYLDDEARYRYASARVEMAARAYAELQKGN